ncbi:MAG: carbon storage regulator CsrA [Planctomycetes bacterium]|nr:carbon storage regulator CsrA [Planctomycetota bacterium]
MLVLSRQKNETIMIGDDVEITIVDIKGDKVRVGISAPKNIAVHRKEVYLAIKEENIRAAQAAAADLAALGDLFPVGLAQTPAARAPAAKPPAGGHPAGGSASSADRGDKR